MFRRVRKPLFVKGQQVGRGTGRKGWREGAVGMGNAS